MTPATVLEPLEIGISTTDMIAYAGATWDWHQLHYDHRYLVDHGFEAPVVDGQMFGGLLVRFLGLRFGHDAVITELSMTYRNLMFAGETLRVEAESETRPDGLVAVTARISILASDDRPERMAVDPANAIIRLPEVAA